MKRLIAAVVLASLSGTALAGSVNGYFRKDGTYVAPYQRSAPDAQRWNNYGSQTNGGSQRDEFSSSPAYNQQPAYQPYQPYQPYKPYKAPQQNYGSGY